MKLGFSYAGADVYHSVREDFGDLLRGALNSERVISAMGPFYSEDPARDVLAPFQRSARETRWSIQSEKDLAPDEILEKVRQVRTVAGVQGVQGITDPNEPLDWTRAGLVLEIARRRGVKFVGRGTAHFDWKMRGTVTGRFGCETHREPGWSVNPLSMGEEDRRRLVPSDATRMIAVFDFKAMDVCSMGVIIPEFAKVLGDHPDPYTRIKEAAHLSAARDVVKLNFLTWAYGGKIDPSLQIVFEHDLWQVGNYVAGLQHGEFPRKVQATSAIAFRAALSRALPLLTDIHFIPMLTVHDELALDVSEVGLDRLGEVSKALEEGASQRLGRPYRVGIKTGYTYEEAKHG